MGYQIQEKSIGYEIWVVPDRSSLVHGPVRSGRVSELVQVITDTADHWPFDWPGHLRIVTNDGRPVSRWKVWAGRAKQLRRRY
jgi:hypothetical protein